MNAFKELVTPRNSSVPVHKSVPTSLQNSPAGRGFDDNERSRSSIPETHQFGAHVNAHAHRRAGERETTDREEWESSVIRLLETPLVKVVANDNDLERTNNQRKSHR